MAKIKLVLCVVIASVIAMVNGYPTSPMESVSSGLAAMVHGQGKASRSASTAPLPIVSNVPIAQSTPLPLMQDQLASTVQPMIVSSPASMIISSTMPPPLPIALNASGESSGVSSSQAVFPPGGLDIISPQKYDSNQEVVPPNLGNAAIPPVASAGPCALAKYCKQALIPPNWQPGTVASYGSSAGVSSPSIESVPVASSNVSKQGLFPSQITSLPGALASQMQGQMSSLQQQVTQVGGSLISQTQDQMSSLQSQMASIPSALGSLVPSGLVPQRAPVSTVSPSIVSTIAPVPVPVVTSAPSVLPVTSQLPIAVQSQ